MRVADVSDRRALHCTVTGHLLVPAVKLSSVSDGLLRHVSGTVSACLCTVTDVSPSAILLS